MRISVCIVTYNHEAYIEECVRSVAAQDVDGAIEIVVADDASTDGTATVLAALQREFPDTLRVILREKNLGAGENFADTIAQCRGAYVAFLEGDNTWSDPSKLSRQVAMLDAHPNMAFAFHRTRTLTEPAVPPDEETLVPAQHYPPVNDITILFGPHNPVPLGSMMVRRPLLAEIRQWTEGLKLGDWPLCMMLACHGTIGYLPREMSRQRMHGGGTWTVRPLHMRLLYGLEMLHRVTGLLEGEARTLALARRDARLASWAQMVWSGADEDREAARTAIAAMPERDCAEMLLWALLSHGHHHWLGLKTYHGWSQEQLAAHRAARTWAQEQVASHRAARTLAEEQIAASRRAADEQRAAHAVLAAQHAQALARIAALEAPPGAPPARRTGPGPNES